MRTSIVLAALIAAGGCRSKDATPKAGPPVAVDAAAAAAVVTPDAAELAMQLDPALLAQAEADRSTAWKAREKAAPKRTTCRTGCDVAKEPSVIAATCNALGDGVAGIGHDQHAICHPMTVVIDCCKALPVDPLPPVVAALGWADATPAQRAAIAWIVVRVVWMHVIIDKLPDDFPAGAAAFAPPRTTTTPAGEVQLVYWRGRGGPRFRFVPSVVSFAADGTPTVIDGEEVEPLARDAKRQAVDAANAALDAGH